MRFQLDEDQLQKLEYWQEAIKTIYGEYGQYTFKFEPNGIGYGVEVHSKLTNTSIDLTDVSKW